MGKLSLDIKVYVDDEYVYMSVKDWKKIANILSNISQDWSVSEEKGSNPNVFKAGKVVH